MKKFLLNIIKYAVIISLTGYLLWNAFDTLDGETPADKWGSLKFHWLEADKLLLIASGVAAILSHLVRAQRWRILLRPLGYEVGLMNSFHAVINGYFINLAIPRGGEVSRPISLNKMEGVPVDKGLGTVVMERVIDMVFLLICIGTVVLFQLSTFSDFLTRVQEEKALEGTAPETGMDWKTITLIALAIAGVITIIVLFIFKRELFQKIIDAGKNFWIGMKSGLASVFQLKQRGWFIFHSLLIWFFYYVMLYTVLLAFDDTKNLGPLDALTIFIVGGIAMALPMPGGAGTYHYLVPRGLVYLCGVADLAKTTAFATIFHGLQTVVLIVLGAIGLYEIQRRAAKRKPQLDKSGKDSI